MSEWHEPDDVDDAREARHDLTARFFAKVRMTEGCWLWTGATAKGYGIFRVGDKRKLSTHVAWEFVNAPVPAGMVICHTCDTPLCVRLEHLWLGTSSENMQDAVRKGRHHETRRTAQLRKLLEED